MTEARIVTCWYCTDDLRAPFRYNHFEDGFDPDQLAPTPRTEFQRKACERFDAIVTGASDKGTWVRLLDPPVEGKLTTGANGLDVGDTLHVQLVSTNVERGYIDFSRVGM